MEALNFRNNYVQNQPQEVRKRLESNENFTALDTEKLKQDTVEIASKAKDNANENFVFRTLRNFGVDDPKKLLKSLALSIGTVIAVAIFANKLTKPCGRLGNKIDSFLTGDNVIGKCRNKVVEFLKQAGKFISEKMPKPKVIENAKNVFKDPEKIAKPKWTIFRGFENGAKGLFSNTIVETMQNALEKDKSKAMSTLTKLLGNNAAKAEEIIADLSKMEKVQFADKLLDEIAKANNCTLGSMEFEKVLEKLSDSKAFGDGFKFIKMDKGGFMGAWWPANFINSIVKKVSGKEYQALQGDLGDSLIKYAAVRGKLGKTLPSKIIQIIPPLVGDQVSNFVNDKSGFGVLLCANLVGNFNKLQDAPKNKKVKTAVNDVASGSLSWLVGLPISYGTMYGLASLKNMAGNDILTKLGRGIGKFFAIGLDSPGKLGGIKGVLGGVGRFAMVLFVISPFVGKIIDKLCAKIFGKPYDPTEAEKQKKLEEEKNKVIPELGITQGELQERIQKNPQAIQKMQTNPELVKAIDKNPKLMLDLLDGKDIDTNEVLKKPKTDTQSPMLKNMINASKSDISNETELFGSKNKEKKTSENNTKPKDTATYIPNSAFVAPKQELSSEVQTQYNRLMSRADKSLSEAEKYI